MIARILDPSVFEVEVEVPVNQLAFLQDVTTINARTLDGHQLDLALRVILPVQNTRTATRIVRFRMDVPPAEAMLANNAVVTVQTPITSPSPVIIVPKDAVIPVAGGHIVYLAIDGRAKRQPIKLGAAVASGFIVQSGLAAGALLSPAAMNSYPMAKPLNMAVIRVNQQPRLVADGAADQTCH